jgi:uncharacterized protein
MIYRPYGSTGDHVSVIGFGGMRFADQNNVDACAQLVQKAYDSGITYFDTAPAYGKSEELFGVAFREMKKTRTQRPFYVATKTFRSEPAEIRKELEQSLQRMGLDYIDFYHVWCVMSLEVFQNRKAKGALAEFERLQNEGLIRHICISSHMNGEDVGTVLQDYPFAGVLLGYSAMNFSYREKALQEAAQVGAGVVVMNPLGGGLIPQHPDRFAFLKTNSDESVVQAGLRFLINDSRITVALVGLSDQQQLTEALSAVDGFAPIPPAQIEKIKTNLKQAFTELCTGCGYCDHCPEGIPVPRLMDAYNHKMLAGGDKALLDRLYWHWDISAKNEVLRKCTQCRLCEEACTQHLPVTDRIEEIRRIAESAG